MNQHIKCPVCHQEDTWREDNPSRPFCSARCKLIDLGAWATEQHRLPGEVQDASKEEDEDKKE